MRDGFGESNQSDASRRCWLWPDLTINISESEFSASAVFENRGVMSSAAAIPAIPQRATAVAAAQNYCFS